MKFKIGDKIRFQYGSDFGPIGRYGVVCGIICVNGILYYGIRFPGWDNGNHFNNETCIITGQTMYIDRPNGYFCQETDISLCINKCEDKDCNYCTKFQEER